MATAVPITDLAQAGVAPAAQVNADTTNNTLAFNDGKVWIEIVSSDAGTQTVTVVTPGTVAGGLAIGDLVVSVPAGATRVAGPFPPALFNQPDGSVVLTPSVNGATIKLRAFHLP